MNDFLKQDIFFFITTLSVIFLTILFGILVVYLIKISKKVDHIADKIKNETDLLSTDLAELRNNIRSTGFKLRHLASFFGKFGKRSKK